jgi:hypothetical protein
MLTKLYYIINLNKLLQVGILTFYRASVSSPFNRSPWFSVEKWLFSVTLRQGARSQALQLRF